MDIEYLLFLQNFRNNINDALTPFMEWISLFAVTYLIMIPVFVYWVLDRKKGLYTLASYYLCCGFNAVAKLTACVYRPWIRDARVLPAGDAITTATGYSFPSGHTVTAGPIYGGLAVSSWKSGFKFHKLLSVLLVCMVLLTGFSRNYLGVHTPQDVFVGICETVFWLIVTSRVFAYLREHPEKENLLLLILFVLGWLCIAYITYKPYPMDYVGGKLLVDPQKMMNDGYGDIALVIAFAVGRYIERTWIDFDSLGLNFRGVCLGIICLGPLWAMITYMKPVLDGMLGAHWGHFANNFVIVLYCVALVPALIKFVQTNDEEESF